MTKKIRPIHQPQLGHLSRRLIFDFCQWLFPRDRTGWPFKIYPQKRPFDHPSNYSKFPAFSSLGPGGRERAARRGARAPGEREPAERAEPCAADWPGTAATGTFGEFHGGPKTGLRLAKFFWGRGNFWQWWFFFGVVVDFWFVGDSWKCWRIQWLNSCFLELNNILGKKVAEITPCPCPTRRKKVPWW